MSPMPRRRPDGNISYVTAHQRLGKAADHKCDCGEQAYEWCYLGGDPDELDDKGLTYSLKNEFYKPMCRSCHRKYDYPHGDLCQRGHNDWRIKPNGKRCCRLCHYAASRRSLERNKI